MGQGESKLRFLDLQNYVQIKHQFVQCTSERDNSDAFMFGLWSDILILHERNILVKTKNCSQGRDLHFSACSTNASA